MRTKIGRNVASLLVALVLLAPSALGVERKGLIFSIGLGGGAIDCSGCEALGGVSVGGHLGYMLRPRVALLADGWVLSHREDLELVVDDFTYDRRYSQTAETNAYTFTGAVQVWPIERLWLRAGLGVGQTDEKVERVTVEGEQFFAWGLGAGVELLQRRNFVLDLSARFSSVDQPGGSQRRTALQLGVNWY